MSEDNTVMSKKALADHLADVHYIWLTRREYQRMGYDDIRRIHDDLPWCHDND